MIGLIVTSEMKVSEVIERFPATHEVFRRYGCPDMSRAIVRLMCRVMSVKAAARVHRLPLDQFPRDLNAVAGVGRVSLPPMVSTRAPRRPRRGRSEYRRSH